jgi:phosphatidylserine/phosphatidylglycerophosphate/cardiolipin synthase-like enzyme
MVRFQSLGPILGLILSMNLAQANSSGIAPGFYNNADGSPLIALIHSATRSIDIEIYTMYDLNVRNAIRDEIAKNIPVRVIQEPAPDADSCHPFAAAGEKDDADCTDEKLLISQVQAAGGTYIPYNKAALCADPSKSCYQHGKLIIVDQGNAQGGAQGTAQGSAMISTGNYDATNLCDLSQDPSNCNRDYSFVDQDTDVLSALEQIFNNDIQGQSYDLSSIVTGSVAQKITVSPLSLTPMVQFIQSAKTTLDVENQYLEQTDMNQALETAAESGVKVNVMVSSECYYGTPSESETRSFTSIYSAFDSAGINSSMFTKSISINGKPGYLHAKAMVADGNRAWLGSVNGSNAATSNNREFGVFFSNPVWVKALDAQIVADHKAAGAENWQQSLACDKD